MHQKGLRESDFHKAPAWQALRPEFYPQSPCTKDGHSGTDAIPILKNYDWTGTGRLVPVQSIRDISQNTGWTSPKE